MARSFLVPINLNNLELQNFRVHNIDSDPTGSAGRLYYNTSSNSLKFYNGTSWLTIATGGSTFTLGSTSVSIGGTTTTVQGLTLGSSSVWNGNTIDVAYGGTGTTTGSITGTGTLTFTAGAGNNSINLRPTGSGSVNLGSTTGSDGFAITGLKDPSSDYDAANKKYVDSVAQGLNIHESVKYATTGELGTTGNITSGGTITKTYSNGTSGVGATLTVASTTNWTAITIDGQSLTVGDRVLIKNETEATLAITGAGANDANGIYTVTQVGTTGNNTSFIFTRATDNDQVGEIKQGDLTYVVNGSANGGQGWVESAVVTGVGNGYPITWTQFSGTATTLAGAGLVTNGTNPNTIDVNVDGTTLEVSADVLRIKDTAVTAASYGSSSSVATFTVNSKGQLTLAASTAISGLNASVISAGTLTVGVGGTGAQSFTSGGIIRGNGSSALSVASASDIVTAIGSTAVTNATNATNVAVTNDAATATSVYPTWVGANSGNNGVKTTSAALSFVPSTGTLSATVFSGSGASLTSLNATNLSSGTVSSARGVTSGSSTGSFLAYNGTTAAAGQLDGGSTNPSGTTRLNYGGYLYATQLFAGQLSGLTSLALVAPSNASTGYAVSVTGGASSGTTGQSGGAISITGGASTSGTSTNSGGSITITGGAANTTAGIGGSVTINGGQGSTANGNGSIAIGSSNTDTVGIGNSTSTTTVTGAVRFPTVGTSGFVKLGASGALSADTNTYLTSSTGVTTINGSSGSFGSATVQANGNLVRYYRATNSAGQTTTINHGYGQWVLVQVYKTSDGTIADTDVTNTATNNGTTTIGFATSQTAGDYTIVIIG